MRLYYKVYKFLGFKLCNLKSNSTMRISLFSSMARSTIFALSSGPGKAGVAVIRVSGPESVEVVHRMTSLKAPPEPRKAIVTKLKDSSTGEFLDQGILLYFKSPKSFTGEDSCELHIHGGVAVISSILTSLSKIPNFKLAQAGEFTRRAFVNHKLDLTAVEGLADLIAAETEAQRKQALRQMDGQLHYLYSSWRNRIIKIAAHVEAYIDFSEDENIDDGLMNTVMTEANALIEEISKHLCDNRRGERLRKGVHVVIVGEPNVGKSSLLNVISERPVAIVSPFAGTTRDVVECHVNIGGYPVVLSDTAGLRQSQDEIEREGMARALDRARLADVIIVMLEAANLIETAVNQSSIEATIKNLIDSLGLSEVLKIEGNKIIVAINKIDIGQQLPVHHGITGNYVMISCKTGRGIDELLEQLKDIVTKLCVSDAGEHPSLTQERHRIHLNECVTRLKAFFEVKQDLAIAAYHLRKGGEQLGKISGEFTTEDLLDIIFKDFCIGK